MKIFTLRLGPEQDLRKELDKFTKENKVQAGFIITCVGSLKQAILRYADMEEGTELTGNFEIVSLVGTLSQDGSHLHAVISDETGKTVGGHVKKGCIIDTTVEIVIGELEDRKFTRDMDEKTGYKELKIK